MTTELVPGIPQLRSELDALDAVYIDLEPS